MSDPNPEAVNADRNLLLGILALQMEFISRESLGVALHAWVADKKRPLGEILVDQKALRLQDRDLLELLVQEHTHRHGENAEQRLPCLNTPATVRDDLAKIADKDLQDSLEHALPTEPGSAAKRCPHQSLPSEPPTSLCPRFRELRRHARGGLGDVYVAEDNELHREVALKRIQARHADDPTRRARFMLEAEITGGLEHPGIVPVYAFGWGDDGRPYYAMRFVRGESLAEVIGRLHDPKTANPRASERLVDFHKLLARFVEVCNTIAYAHARGVLHRDIKPSNIMLGPYGETLVLDWGLAKMVGDESCPEAAPAKDPLSTGSARCEEHALRPPSARRIESTVMGATAGTPAFMSPEQAAGRIDLLGPPADIYSLGATLYAILTGHPPLEGLDEQETLRRVRAGDVPRPRVRNHTVPPPLEAICLKAMALRPEDRYPTAQALADDIEHWLAHERVSAYAEPVRHRFQRWLGQHRAGVLAAAVFGVIALIGLTGSLIVLTSANYRELQAHEEAARQRDQALRERERAVAHEEIARAEEANARQSAAEAKAVLDFFQKTVLAATRPQGEQGGLGRQVTVRAALEAAEPRIAKAFNNQPVAEARIRQTLGETYIFLGEPRRAISELERALAIFKAQRGPKDRDTLESMDTLASAYQIAGRWSDALPLFEKTLRLRKATFGAEDLDTLASLSNLAVAYRAAGRPTEAIGLCEEALRIRKAKLGPTHPQTLTTMNNLAMAYQSAGRLADAIALHQHTLTARQSTLGPEHPNTLVSMHNLASAYQDAGRWADAMGLFEETLRIQKSKLGPDHPRTLQTMNNLAAVYRAAGRPAEAIARYEEALPKLRAKLSPDHPEVLTSAGDLAQAYEEMGQASKAIPLYQETLRLMKPKWGPEHSRTLRIQFNLARAYSDTGQAAEAIALLKETLTIQSKRPEPADSAPDNTRKLLARVYLAGMQYAAAESLLVVALNRTKQRFGDQSLETACLDTDLGDCFLRQGKYADAERLLRQSLAVRADKEPDAWSTYKAQSLLGSALLGQQKYAAAEPLLLEGYEGLTRLAGKIPSSAKDNVTAAGERLVQLYDAWGRKDQAATWRKRLASLPSSPTPEK